MTTDYTTYHFSGKEWRQFVLLAYPATWGLCFLFYHSWSFSAVCGASCLFLLEPYRDHLAERRRRLLTEQFRDLLYALADAIATGRQMEAALEEGLSHLRGMYDSHTPMIEELQFLVRSVRENRGNEEELLSSLAVRSGCEDIRNFADVYCACRETGGNLEEVIGHSIEVMTEKMEIEREIHALTVQKRYEGHIIAAMPVAVLILLNLFSPDYLDVMYTTLRGRLLMTTALGGLALAYRLTLHLTKIYV